MSGLLWYDWREKRSYWEKEKEVGKGEVGGWRECWPSVPLLSCCVSGRGERETVCSGFGRSGWKPHRGQTTQLSVLGIKSCTCGGESSTAIHIWMQTRSHDLQSNQLIGSWTLPCGELFNFEKVTGLLYCSSPAATMPWCGWLPEHCNFWGAHGIR